MAATAAPIAWFLVSVFSIWITIVVPPTLLFAWTSGRSALPWLLPSLVLSPAIVLAGQGLIVVTGIKVRQWIMQGFGIGAIFCVAAAMGSVLTLFVAYQWVAGLVACVGAIWTLRAVQAARHIQDVHLRFTDARIRTPQRIVQISDVHIGSRSAAFLKHVVDQINGHKPDLVLITGDLVDLDGVGYDELRALRQLTCPCFMSTGNHEFDIDTAATLSAIESNGVSVLRDDAVTLGDLHILGIDDRKRGLQIAPVLQSLPRDSTRYEILLYHRPDGWEAAKAAGIDLTLAGHTHHGQIWPFNYVVKLAYAQLSGCYRQGDQHLYVSTGTGTWGPAMRLGSQCEMTIIDLAPA